MIGECTLRSQPRKKGLHSAELTYREIARQLKVPATRHRIFEGN